MSIINNNNNNDTKDEQPQVVFHAINWNAEDDEDTIDELRDATMRKSKIPTATLPTLENAALECFSLAVNTHDVPAEEIAQAVWHWEGTAKSIIPDVDPKAEEDTFKSWIPRPLFLPTWAVVEL